MEMAVSIIVSAVAALAMLWRLSQQREAARRAMKLAPIEISGPRRRRSPRR